MKEILLDLLKYIGLNLIDKSIESIVKRKVQNVVEDNSTDPNIPEIPSPSTIKYMLFNQNSIFRAYLLGLCKDITILRNQINNTKGDILYSVGFSYYNRRFNEIVYDLIDSSLILYSEDANGKENLSYTDGACTAIITFVDQLYSTYLKDNLISFEVKDDVSGFPSRVLAFIDKVYRTGTPSSINKIVSIPPLEQHQIYTSENQKDIFGGELITSKIAIIKVKDTISDVFSYLLVLPGSVDFDNKVVDANWITDVKVTETVKSWFKENNTDLTFKEINFKYLENLIKIVY